MSERKLEDKMLGEMIAELYIISYDRPAEDEVFKATCRATTEIAHLRRLLNKEK